MVPVDAQANDAAETADLTYPGARPRRQNRALQVTAVAPTLARVWPDVLSNAVDPGWVPTKIGGPAATGDLQLARGIPIRAIIAAMMGRARCGQHGYP
jgi:hypothetical protein